MLPVAGVVAGVVGVLLGIFALVQISKVKQSVTDLEPKVAQIDAVKATADQTASTADQTKKDLAVLQKSTQDAFNAVGPELGALRGDITKIQESMKRPTPTAKGGGPVVAGPGEYVVKAGDSGAKIARANGCSLPDLQAVNPNVNWTKLKIGDKIKLPKK